jgi:hypothetical protein
MEEIMDEDYVGDLRRLINDELIYDKEKFYNAISLLKVLPEILDIAKKNK